MKGEKTLTSGNVARWSVQHGLEKSGVEARFSAAPSPDDLREFRAFALGPMGSGAKEAGAFVGMGPKGRQAAKAAFDAHLGRSSN
jgi:hypothetical protein